MDLTCIILSAGSSSRMTGNKQLLLYRGRSFIRILAGNIKQLNVARTICVTGFLKEEIESELSGFDIDYLHNQNHHFGQTNSLKLAINSLINSKTSAAMITLTDQPLIPLQHYQELLEKHLAHPEQIVATKYAESYGVPCIMPRKHFKEITELSDGASPKSILKNNQEKLVLIICEQAAMDIDSDEDYNILIGGNE